MRNQSRYVKWFIWVKNKICFLCFRKACKTDLARKGHLKSGGNLSENTGETGDDGYTSGMQPVAMILMSSTYDAS